MSRITSRIALVGTLVTATGSTTAGQEAAKPHQAIPTDLGIKSSEGKTSRRSVMAWAHWSVLIADCVRAPRGTECKVEIMNGSDADHRVCVESASLATARKAGRTELVVVTKATAADQPAGRDTRGCVAVRAHSAIRVALRTDRLVRGREGALGFTLRQEASGRPVGVQVRFDFPVVPIRPGG